MKKVLISARDVCKTFLGGEKNRVLNHVDLDIYEGDFTVVMGSSGAGKSTLLYALSGMDQATSGRIRYKDKELGGCPEKQMAALRSSEFGFIFQQSHLISNLTLFENVAVAGYISPGSSSSKVPGRAEKLLLQMHAEKAADRLPSQVSGGEAQRAALARAVIHEPKLLFADEPTGALNRQNTDGVLDLLSALNDGGQSILAVTHDVRAAVRANRLLYLEDGRIAGEKELPRYRQKEARAREAQIQEWLSSMEW